MNQLQYYLLNKVHNERKIDENELEGLWQDYCLSSEKYSFPMQFSKDSFSQILSTTYDVITLRLDEEEAKTVLNHYFRLLLIDAIVGSPVNDTWAIDHIWYCATTNLESKDSKEYSDCLPLIQKKLIKELHIEESFTNKVKRKINSKLLSVR